MLNQVPRYLGTAFRKALKAQGLTQAELAKACCLVLGSIKLIEKGEGISAATDRVADYLGQALVVRGPPRAPLPCFDATWWAGAAEFTHYRPGLRFDEVLSNSPKQVALERFAGLFQDPIEEHI
jgi:transcriptional regulator with XRE-family HTH domain